MNQLQIPFWLNVFHAGAHYLIMAPDFMQESLGYFCVFQRIFLRRLFICIHGHRELEFASRACIIT